MEILHKQDLLGKKISDISKKELVSIFYHDIFDYPLRAEELIKWTAGDRADVFGLSKIQPEYRSGHYYIEGRHGLAIKRALRKRNYVRKLGIANVAAKLLEKIPTIKMVAITGALAMENADEQSDIDLLIVSSRGLLWTTRLIALIALDATKIPRRRAGEREEKDKLCTNIWMDESDLVFRKRNIFTAHEIAQIIPLVNKDFVYERLIYKNRWIVDYWPNSIKKLSEKDIEILRKKNKGSHLISKYLSVLMSSTIEPVARAIQLWYMKNKRTREVVTKTRAMFHPLDLSKIVLDRLRVDKK